jgi:4-hydroxy-3-polyprenylbenzoate decarboxylase
VGSYVVAITGASGSVYGLRLVEQLLSAGHEVTLTVTPMGREVMSYETGFALPEGPGAAGAVLGMLELPPAMPLRTIAPDAMFDRIASGSALVDAMVVMPASMGFCASVAAGLAADLPERAADVMLKEHRPLVMVPRETPLSLVHLKNLTALAEAGAIIVPAMPAFYHRPKTLDDAVNFVVGKVLDALGIEHHLFERWGSQS